MTVTRVVTGNKGLWVLRHGLKSFQSNLLSRISTDPHPHIIHSTTLSSLQASPVMLILLLQPVTFAPPPPPTGIGVACLIVLAVRAPHAFALVRDACTTYQQLVTS